jgi:hypothetical protein
MPRGKTPPMDMGLTDASGLYALPQLTVCLAALFAIEPTGGMPGEGSSHLREDGPPLWTLLYKGIDKRFSAQYLTTYSGAPIGSLATGPPLWTKSVLLSLQSPPRRPAGWLPLESCQRSFNTFAPA